MADTKKLISLAKKADQLAKKFRAVGEGYDRAKRYFNEPWVAAFDVKIPPFDVPDELEEYNTPEAYMTFLEQHNEDAMADLKALTRFDWQQVGRSGGHYICICERSDGDNYSMISEFDPEPQDSLGGGIASLEKWAKNFNEWVEEGVYEESDIAEEVVAFTKHNKWLEGVLKKLAMAEKTLKSYVDSVEKMYVSFLKYNITASMVRRVSSRIARRIQRRMDDGA